MTFSTIQIKYSIVTATPQNLAQGELAYSENSKKLFIGNSFGTAVEIAGEHYMSKFATIEAAIQSMASQIAALQTDQASLDTRITGLQSSFDSHVASNATDFNTINDQITAIQSQLGGGGSGSVQSQITALRTDVDGLVVREVDHLARTSAVESKVAPLSYSTAQSELTIASDVLITGGLRVQGTQTIINSTVTSIKDPVILLGQEDTNVVDGLDRGIVFGYPGLDQSNTLVPKYGFFGFDTVTKKFKFISEKNPADPDNVSTGTTGVIQANIEGNADTATKLAVAREIGLVGEVTGAALFDGTSDVQLSVSVDATDQNVANKIVRRDATGAITVGGLTAHGAAIFHAGISGVDINNNFSSITGFVISGGTF
jgi:hypothetical protein